MQEDFHYYATYCAAYMAGYSHDESMGICYSAQLVDCCGITFLKKINGPSTAATTQSQIELINAATDLLGLQTITRIWASFHFLPYDLYAEKRRRNRYYMNKFRLICGPNGELVEKTVRLAKGKGLQSAGIAMHVLADTWAHSYFAGTPSRVINNTTGYFYEITEDNKEKKIHFKHNPAVADDVITGSYSGSVSQENERSIMNLGHGRAGHFPDYSFAKYKYMPAWYDYEVIEKDNPSDYYKAFTQMVQALMYLRGDLDEFTKETYAIEKVKPWEDEIKSIISKRQINASDDWKKLGEKLSGESIPDFEISKYQKEYSESDKKGKANTFLGLFFTAAIAQKSMVTHEIFKSGNLLAGFSKELKAGGKKR